MHQVIDSALKDIREGIKLHRVWLALAQEDIGDQHRRTTLGPMWLLINYLAFAGTFIFVFHRGSAGDANYAIYVGTGLLVWFYIMETITQSITLFVREESFIQGTTLPLSVYVMRLAMQAAIRAGYALLGCILILVLSGVSPTLGWGWSLFGIVLILIITPAAIILFAFLGAFFPDSQFIVSNLMRIGMFLTPVFWSYEGSGGLQHLFYYWNPFTYFLEIVRVPILYGVPPLASLAFCMLLTVILWILSIILLGSLRKRVVFVL